MPTDPTATAATAVAQIHTADKNGNVNCMDGVECPKCGEHKYVDVQALVWVQVQDNGTDDMPSDTEYDSDSLAHCPSCGHRGRFGEWQVPDGT